MVCNERLEHDINSWVKAAFESSMGHLRTVGAIAMDDFLQKMKEVLKEIASSMSPHGTAMSSAELPVPAMPEMPFFVEKTVPGSSRSVGTGSMVPTIFGDKRSVSSVVDPAVFQSSADKPGKNLLRSPEGF